MAGKVAVIVWTPAMAFLAAASEIPHTVVDPGVAAIVVSVVTGLFSLGAIWLRERGRRGDTDARLVVLELELEATKRRNHQLEEELERDGA